MSQTPDPLTTAAELAAAAGEPPSPTNPMFSTNEMLWYDNGRWGEAGYAIPNPMGKTYTNNTVIAEFVTLVGRNLFELMHRPSVKFYVAPQKQFWYDLHQMVITGRKRLNDRTRRDNDSNGLDVVHAAPNPQEFMVYPIPYFSVDRVRQGDIREYAQYSMLMLSEAMQHSENELATYVTDRFTGVISKYLQEILAQMAMKYFGYPRSEAYKPDFALKDSDFASYDQSKVLTSVEMTEERPPLQWWPTENDLSGIRGIPFSDALPFCKRWPASPWLSASNVGGLRSTQSGPIDASNNINSGTFVAPPGQAP